MLQPELDQLRSPDAEVRRRAIIALGRSKDRSVLPALADVHRNDPDPALRELAQKAGRYIQSQAAEPEPLAPAYTPPPEPEERPIRPVSGAQAELARGYFDRALDLQVRGDNVKAVEMLGKALDTNPALRHDKMMINLAMDLTGLGSSAAIATLVEPDNRRAFMQQMMGMEVRVGKRRVDEDATWGGALLDLSIYGLVNGAIVFVTALLAARVLFSLFTSAVATAPSANASASLQLLQELNQQQVSLPLAALYGLLTGVAAVITLLVVDAAIHVIATSVLGGEGTLAGLIRKTTLYYTVLTALSLVLNIVFGVLALNADANTLSTLTFLPLLVSLGMLIWAGKLTGDAYDFGTGKGCASIFLGYFGLSLLLACCSVTLSMALASSLQGFVR